MSAGALEADREDLLRVVEMRFGPIPDEMRRQILQLDRVERVGRMILVAANAPDLDTVAKELKEPGAFRVGARAVGDPVGRPMWSGSLTEPTQPRRQPRGASEELRCPAPPGAWMGAAAPRTFRGQGGQRT